MLTQLTSPTIDDQIWSAQFITRNVATGKIPQSISCKAASSAGMSGAGAGAGWLVVPPRRAPDLVQAGSHQRALSLNCATKTAPSNEVQQAKQPLLMTEALFHFHLASAPTSPCHMSHRATKHWAGDHHSEARLDVGLRTACAPLALRERERGEGLCDLCFEPSLEPVGA